MSLSTLPPATCCVTSSLSYCACFPNTQKGMIILCYRQLGRIQTVEPSVKHLLTLGFQSREEEPCAVGEVRGVPQQAELPQSPGPSQMKGQNRKSPGALTLQLCRQLYPSLHSDGNGAPREHVQDNAHQIQPPDHLYRRRAADQRTPAGAWT